MRNKPTVSDFFGRVFDCEARFCTNFVDHVIADEADEEFDTRDAAAGFERAAKLGMKRVRL